MLGIQQFLVAPRTTEKRTVLELMATEKGTPVAMVNYEVVEVTSSGVTMVRVPVSAYIDHSGAS